MTWWHDIQFAIRNHIRRPAACAVAIGILALGLGLNVTALSVLSTLMLHPYAYPHLDRLVLLQDVRPREGAHQGKPIAPADYEDTGVEGAALIRNTPASNVPSPSTLFTINGRAPLSVSDTPRADVQTITPAAFETLGVLMLSGRAFRDGDRDPALRVAIVSRAMARRFWPGADPVGAVIRLGHRAAPPLTIVGVAGDFKLNWYDPESRAVMYLPSAQAPSRRMHALVKANGDPLQLARPTANPVRGIDARLAISGLKPLQEEVDDSLAPVRALTLLLLVCGAVAVALAAAGIYSVLAHWVASRERELGVRLALGAQAGDLMRLVLFEAFRMGLIGLTIGVPLALGAARRPEASPPIGVNDQYVKRNR